MSLVVSSDVIRFAVFEIDLRAGELHKNGLRVPLQEQPFQVLTILLEHAGDVVFRDELRKAIWPENTFVDFDNSLNTAINKIREALGDSADHPRFVETIPRRGYRFIAPVTHDDSRAQTPIAPAPPEANSAARKFTIPHRRTWLVAGAATLLALIATGLWFLSPHRLALGVGEEILIANVVNKTGEAIFDDTLTTALMVKLYDSPYLNPVFDQSARERCQKKDTRALLTSSIERTADGYLIALDAVECGGGKRLARERQTASGHAEIVNALAKSAVFIRSKLGEPLPNPEVEFKPGTTTSLEALRAFVLASEKQDQRNLGEAIALYKRAVELDPAFAMALQRLGGCYLAIGDEEQAEVYRRRAYEARDHAGRRQSYDIAARYWGDYRHPAWDRVLAIRQIYVRDYPRDYQARLGLITAMSFYGNYVDCAQQAQEAIRINPGLPNAYMILAQCKQCLNDFEAAKNAYQEAAFRGANPQVYSDLYAIAVVQSDDAAKRRWAAAAKGSPGEVDLLQIQAAELAFAGKIRAATERLHEAQRLIGARPHFLRSDPIYMEAAFRATVGDISTARAILAKGRVRTESQIGVALLLARLGDPAAAEKLMNEQARVRPEDTNIRFRWFPVIRAAIALQRDDPAGAIRALEPGRPYENWQYIAKMIRGEAYLRLGDSFAAAKQFQFILDHRGILPLSGFYLQAHVWKARAEAATGNITAAKQAYEAFFALWKDADPDIPILRQAKAEYARLK